MTALLSEPFAGHCWKGCQISTQLITLTPFIRDETSLENKVPKDPTAPQHSCSASCISSSHALGLTGMTGSCLAQALHALPACVTGQTLRRGGCEQPPSRRPLCGSAMGRHHAITQTPFSALEHTVGLWDVGRGAGGRGQALCETRSHLTQEHSDGPVQ